MTIDERMMTNFTLEALTSTSINQLVYEACMEHAIYDGVELHEDGKVLRLRDASDNKLIEIKLDTDGTYELVRGCKRVRTDTFEQALTEGLYLNSGRVIPLVNDIVAQGVDPELNQDNYNGVKLRYATTVKRYLNRYENGETVERYCAEITGIGRDMDIHLKLDNGYWMGYADNKDTNEVVLYNTQDLKSILEDITSLQNSETQRQTYTDMRHFNTPERFDAYIEGIQNTKEPNWDFAKEDGMQQ